MCDLGNIFIVVEYDDDIMRVVDYLVDVGLGVGNYGGEVVLSGIFNKVMKDKKFLIG